MRDRIDRRDSLDRYSAAADAPDFSVVITCYFEERSIDEFHRRLSDAMQALGRSYEIIFVNDGSTDATLSKLHVIFERDESVAAVIDLYRNSGQGAAATAGAELACGRAMIFMDSDLQLDPEEVGLLVERFDDGFDVVSGYRETRHDASWRTLPARLANGTMRRVSKTNFRDFGCTFKLIDGRIVRAFECGPFRVLRMAYLMGASNRYSDVPVSHHPRKYGKSGWTFPKLTSFYLDNLVDLSERSFQMVGIGMLTLAVLLVLRVFSMLVWPRALLAEVSDGFLLNAVIVSFLVLAAISAGIGEYVMRAYVILRGRPAYIVRDVLSRQDREESGADEGAL